MLAVALQTKCLIFTCFRLAEVFLTKVAPVNYTVSITVKAIAKQDCSNSIVSGRISAAAAAEHVVGRDGERDQHGFCIFLHGVRSFLSP